MAPDGNGGMYEALQATSLTARGISHVLVFAVDNVLARPVDPGFLGVAALNASLQVVSKAVTKKSAQESAGVFAFDPARRTCPVIEYTELDASRAGDFTMANIANHVLRLDFCRAVASDPNPFLPVHLARKDVLGHAAFKLEKFIFDAFSAEGISHALYQVDRTAEFAPLKNSSKSKEDNPETCLAALQSQPWFLHQ